MLKQPLTVRNLTDELKKLKDKTRAINVYNHIGELTENITLFDEKYCVILSGNADISKEPLTVQVLIDELQKLKDKTNIVNVYNKKGEFTGNFEIVDKENCVILLGKKPFYKQYDE